MTRRFAAELETIAEDLDLEAGRYLHRVVREPGVTCKVCALPVERYELCPQCSRWARSGLPLADRVGSLIYALKPDSQAYKVVRGYKGDWPGPSHEGVMWALLALGLRGHHMCAVALSATTSRGWAVVPSTQGRTNLVDLTRRLSQRPDHEVAVRFVGGPSTRELRPEQWAVKAQRGLPEHVLVVDDSWVSGAHAQSVAAALKQHGVKQVSIFTVARVLSPDWGPNKPFIKNRLPRLAFEWKRCPWTGGECPAA